MIIDPLTLGFLVFIFLLVLSFIFIGTSIKIYRRKDDDRSSQKDH